jgi:hypothetical protein
MKFVLAFIMMVTVLVFTGCNKNKGSDTPASGDVAATPAPSIGCNIEQSIVGAVASGLSSQLGCTNVDAVKTDLLKATGKVNLCASIKTAQDTVKSVKAQGTGKTIDEKGIIGDIACPLLVNGLVSVGLSKVPDAWGCSGGTSVDMVKAKVTALCRANIPL